MKPKINLFIIPSDDQLSPSGIPSIRSYSNTMKYANAKNKFERCIDLRLKLYEVLHFNVWYRDSPLSNNKINNVYCRHPDSVYIKSDSKTTSSVYGLSSRDVF